MSGPTFPVAPDALPVVEVETGTFTHNTNVVGVGLGRLLEQYKDKPRMREWIAIYLEEAQEIEDAAFALYGAITPATTNTYLQDLIGRIVKQPRRGENNATYSKFLAAKIRINRSRGTAPDVLAVALLILPDPTVTPEETATIVIAAGEPVDYSVLDALEMLAAASAGGMRVIFTYPPAPSASTFKFAATRTEGLLSTATGFAGRSDATTPDGTGGTYRYAVSI